MGNTVIQVHNIVKIYNNSYKCTSLKVYLQQFFRGKKEKYIVKEDKTVLDNVSFSVEAGDVLGVIGKNGAGKSTLLKVLSNIVTPTSGTIEINGRIGSLLEVGTGFHPEFTGLENIYLNGAILGMRKKKIKEKINEIIDFSELKENINLPIKLYSSGMKSRLGFSIASVLDTEIIILDEVLAVGDQKFQDKSRKKMLEIIEEKNRTIILVSHSEETIKGLCNKVLYLKNGRVEYMGDAELAFEKYNEKY